MWGQRKTKGTMYQKERLNQVKSSRRVGDTLQKIRVGGLYRIWVLKGCQQGKTEEPEETGDKKPAQ